jgi:hypothetical protein
MLKLRTTESVSQKEGICPIFAKALDAPSIQVRKILKVEVFRCVFLLQYTLNVQKVGCKKCLQLLYKGFVQVELLGI